jgi:uncharacterized protein with ATP-grasp and redox domains
MKYFKVPYTAVNLLKQFRTLSKKLHPDREGGDHNKFIEMQNQYRDFLYIVDNGDIPLSKCQSKYFKEKLADQPRAEKVKKEKHETEAYTDVMSILKDALKKEVKRRKIKKVSYKRGTTVYIVNVNDFFNNIIDKLF